jgi:hypothetical protein
VATSAIVIGGAKLNQQAVIASNDFPRIYRGKSRGHRVVGGPERAFLTNTGTNFGGRFQVQCPICGHRPVDVKGKMRRNQKLRPQKPSDTWKKAGKTRKNKANNR